MRGVDQKWRADIEIYLGDPNNYLLQPLRNALVMMERDCSYLTRSAPDAADKYSELAAGENDPMPMWGQN